MRRPHHHQGARPPRRIVPLRFEIVDGLGGVDPRAWDRLVGPDDPFCEHVFLYGFETSGSVGEAHTTGWVPAHVLAWRGDELAGAVPFYEKHHSYGEYVFDWQWAHASERAGIPYYPKMVAAVPFTPVPGRRLLVAPGEDVEAVEAALIEGMQRAADDRGAWSAHVLFCTEDERDALTRAGFAPRMGYQFHWERDAEWTDFDAFLRAMRHGPRKQIRRERRVAAEAGLELSTVPGTELHERDWDGLWTFYQDTGARKWGSPYLTRRFFDHVRDQAAHRVLATLAHTRDGEPVAGSLFLGKGRALYGRYWGATVRVPMLHFELCYYRPIEWAVMGGLERFEAGAQGEHKLRRGLMPQPTWSAHWMRVDALSEAIRRFLPAEARSVRQEVRLLARHGPFRREPRG